MYRRALIEEAVLGTDNGNLVPTSLVLDVGIIVPLAMHRPRTSQKVVLSKSSFMALQGFTAL
jgi:hypothetical protein